MELTDSINALFVDTARSLQGSTRRLFMARTVKDLGAGGQRCAARARGWSRVTLRKGPHAWESGFTCLDAFRPGAVSVRKPAGPPCWLISQRASRARSQTDPPWRTTRRYTRRSAAEVRRQLRAQQGYTDDTRPTVQTLTTKRNALGYDPKKVVKSQPQKPSRQPTPSSSR